MKNPDWVAQFLGAVLFIALSASSQALDGGMPRVNTSNGWKAFEVISWDDNPAGGADYAMSHSFDGTGALRVDDATLRLLVNHETGDATVSEVDINLPNLRLAINNTMNTGNTGGVSFVMSAQQAYDRWSSDGGSSWTDTVDISNTSFSRFCSSQSYAPDTFGPGRGFIDHLYITGEEGDTNRLFVLETATRDFYQLSGVVGDASAVLGGIGGMPYDAFENAALIDTGETQYVALVLSPDGGTASMQLYIGIKGKDANGDYSNSFLARNGLAYGSYFYFNDSLPTTTPSTDGFFDATISDALTTYKLEDVDTSPSAPTRFVLGNQYSGAFVFDTYLDFTGGIFNAGTSGFSITMIDDIDGEMNNHDNVDWTAATQLGGTSYPDGLIFVNEDDGEGEIWQMEPDGSNQIKVGETNVGAESTGIFDLSGFLGYKPASVLMTTNQGLPASLTILINPNAELVDITVSTHNDFDADHIAGWIWKGQSNGHETESQNWQLTFPLYSNNWGVPNRFYHPTFPDQANWEIVTTGDFNNDGDADILWRNNSTAQWKVWQMQNGVRVAQTDWGSALLPVQALTVVGAGDSDADGDDDIILYNTATDEVQFWEIQNYDVVSVIVSVLGTSGYVPSRVGDFNKDGMVDLLWRGVGTDVLLINGSPFANTGVGYNPVCTGDFDNDGDDDIMLINSSTMQEKWFVMENFARTQKVGATNTGYVFQGCGDYDGDGDADILWRRLSDDANRVILQQNYGLSKQTVYTNAFGGVNGFVYRGNSN